MAKQSNKAVGVAVAVGGVAALGVAAYALSQSKGGQKEASQMLSGGYGGGATGGYSDAFTDVTTPNTSQPNTSQPNISGTVEDILNKVVQTPQAQPTPIVINPSPDTFYEDIIPLINAADNPSDEDSDVKQGAQGVRHGENVSIPDSAGNAYEAFYSALVEEDRAFVSGGGVYIPSSIGSKATTSSTAVEYNPFDFAPTKKQADYSSYNQGKTGGTTNTPSKAQQEFQSNKVYDIGTKESGGNARPSSKTSAGSTTSNKSSSAASSFDNFVSNTVNAAANAIQNAASAVGSFFSGLVGGR